ncbi:MAG: hypothetical protein A2580_17910 [Hydrogenophilales bacterium RIFOXYD1_FULL_62_11]|nr:MAG: hypothetical protein A2580_17910 [Hydrogenophilales bacterium RIFOXYD1_FULL_62_11]
MYYTASITPQVWAQKYAMTVDPSGPTRWDVTEEFNKASEEDRQLYLEGGNDTADLLKNSAHAPDWVKAWSGPFEIHVTETAEKSSIEDQRTGPVLQALLPDSDGRATRAYRHALESMALCLRCSGVSHTLIDEALQTAVDAYGNNYEVIDNGLEIDEALVVSTTHLTHEERAQLDDGVIGNVDGETQMVLSQQGEYGYLVWLPIKETLCQTEAETLTWLSNLEGKISEGFLGVIKKAAEVGTIFIRFDRDADPLPGVPEYDD